MQFKRIVSIQDLSCFGKCSLTVALPIISAMGIETCVIPTAVLSTYTGQFTGYTFRDLSRDIPKIAAHWQKNDIDFDTIYTGYLGSINQIDIMADFFGEFKLKDTRLIIDPVMGDNGIMYPGFTEEFVKKMTRLCKKADIIVPNLTEAALMLGMDYVDSGYTREYIEDILKRLSENGAKKVILTGVSFSRKEQGAAAYDSEEDKIYFCMGENIPGKFHGTGDIFSSALTGALTRGMHIEDACYTAVDFVIRSIKATIDDIDKYWYGVNFEAALPWLIKRMGLFNVSQGRFF